MQKDTEALLTTMQPAAKRAKIVPGPPCDFLATWLWKREAKSDQERFHEPYEYPDAPLGALRLEQRPFSEEGFASTVWDSAIVLAKYFELQSALFAGKRCVELGAGCGLLSSLLGRLGATVVATDLAENLPLLATNVKANHVEREGVPPPRVRELRWGAEAARALLRDEGRVDFVVASDIMYIHEAIDDLVATLDALCDADTTVLLAHGRNRPAEAAFLAAAAAAGMMVTPIAEDALHETFRCLDVAVMKLRRTPVAS